MDDLVSLFRNYQHLRKRLYGRANVRGRHRIWGNPERMLALGKKHEGFRRHHIGLHWTSTSSSSLRVWKGASCGARGSGDEDG